MVFQAPVMAASSMPSTSSLISRTGNREFATRSSMGSTATLGPSSSGLSTHWQFCPVPPRWAPSSSYFSPTPYISADTLSTSPLLQMLRSSMS